MRFYEVVPTAILKHRTVPRRSQHKTSADLRSCHGCSPLLPRRVPLLLVVRVLDRGSVVAARSVDARDVAGRHGCKGAAEEARRGEEGAAEESLRGEEGAAEAGRQEGRAEARG